MDPDIREVIRSKLTHLCIALVMATFIVLYLLGGHPTLITAWIVGLCVSAFYNFVDHALTASEAKHPMVRYQFEMRLAAAKIGTGVLLTAVALLLIFERSLLLLIERNLHTGRNLHRAMLIIAASLCIAAILWYRFASHCECPKCGHSVPNKDIPDACADCGLSFNAPLS